MVTTLTPPNGGKIMTEATAATMVTIGCLSAAYCAEDRICKNLGITEPIAWTLGKCLQGINWVCSKTMNFAVKTATEATDRFKANLNAAQNPDVIDVKASEPEA